MTVPRNSATERSASSEPPAWPLALDVKPNIAPSLPSSWKTRETAFFTASNTG